MYFRRRRQKSGFSVLRKERQALDLADARSSTVAAKTELESSTAATAAGPLPDPSRPILDLEAASIDLAPLTEVDELDDDLYHAKVLALPEGVTEAAADEAYGREAAQLGLSWPQDELALAALHLGDSNSSTTLVTDQLVSGATSRASESTGLTSHFSTEHSLDELAKASVVAEPASGTAVRKSIFFTEYERFLAQAQAQAVGKAPKEDAVAPSSRSVFSTSSGKSLLSLRNRLRRISSFRRPRLAPPEPKRSCAECGGEAETAATLQLLACSHGYCRPCLHRRIAKAMEDDSEMPPRCCQQPIPGAVVKNHLDEVEQRQFMRSIFRYAASDDARTFHPTPARPALGSPTVTRTLKSRLEEVSEDLDDSAAVAVAETDKAQETDGAPADADSVAAAKRSLESEEMAELRAEQVEEMARFVAFEQKQNWLMWTRHGKEKLKLLDQQTESERVLREKQTQVSTTLEDRQVAAEMELREALAQEQKSCLVRLRHMEAYCDPARASAKAAAFPDRVVTERDRIALRQQHNMRNDMERLHQARINVLREKQARQLESLLARQREDLRAARDRFRVAMEGLEERGVREEKGFAVIFARRKERLIKRWLGVEQMLRKKLEERHGHAFGPLPPLQWHDPKTSTAPAAPPASKKTSWVLI